MEELQELEATLRNELQAKRQRVAAAEEGAERERVRAERLERERGEAEGALVMERARAVEAEGLLTQLRATLSTAREEAQRAVTRASAVEAECGSCRALRVERHVLQQELQAADLRSASYTLVQSARVEASGPSIAALQDEIDVLRRSLIGAEEGRARADD
eukprot:5771493-Prymnesium_polylepis.1